MNRLIRLVLAFFIYSVLGLVTMPAYGRFVVMQDELWATNAAIHASISSGDMSLSNQVDAVAGLIAVETASRAAGDSLGSNHVHSVELALSNRLDSVELALTGTSNDLAQAISAETQYRIAGDAANHNEIVGVQSYAESVSNKFDSAVYALATNLNTKVSTNHFGDVTIHGGIVVTDNIYMGEGKNLVLTSELDPYWASVSNAVIQNAVQGSTAYGWGNHELAGYANTNGSIYVRGNVTATSFIGDGSQLSGVSGGVEFPEMTIYSSGATTSIPFTKDYKYYKVVITNTTDVSFDYSGLGDVTGSVLEFQVRLVLTNPLVDAVTIPADGVDGIKYVGDIDITATMNNTVQHLGMMMYSTNKVLLSHWFFDEP